MSGKAVNDIDLAGGFVQMVNNISQKAAAGGKNTIIQISYKSAVRSGKLSGDFIGKR